MLYLSGIGRIKIFMNKKYISFFYFLLSLLIIGCFGNRVPAIKFDGQNYKFGNIKEGKNVVFTFMFLNTGNADLMIEELYVSCYCVIVKEYDKVIKPGEKGKIYGYIDTKGFQGDVVKVIKVTTNIPDAEPAILTLEGKIIPG